MSATYDEYFMRQVIELAAQGKGGVEPNPMVGCVIIQPDEVDPVQSQEPLGTVLPLVTGRGYHKKFGGDHAEVAALKEAGSRARGGTLYVNLEPCSHTGKTPPCCDAIIKAGIKRVVLAMEDPFEKVNGQGIAQLRAAGIEVETGVLFQEAAELNAPYLTRLIKGRPWIIGKWAMTLDGKMATKTGNSYWISNEKSRERVHRIRSCMDGIMIGSRTAMEDDPKLTVRLPDDESPKRTPIRIVFDSGGTLSVFSELALSARDVPLLLVFGPKTPAGKATFWESKGAQVLVLDHEEHEQRLILLMEELCRRGVTNLLVEGGGELLGHLFDMEYLDEVYVFVAPKLVGGANAVVPVAGIGQDLMRTAVRLQNRSIETLGGDVLISGRLDYSK